MTTSRTPHLTGEVAHAPHYPARHYPVWVFGAPNHVILQIERHERAMSVFRHFTIFVGIGRLKAVRLKGRGIDRADGAKVLGRSAVMSFRDRF